MNTARRSWSSGFYDAYPSAHDSERGSMNLSLLEVAATLVAEAAVLAFLVGSLASAVSLGAAVQRAGDRLATVTHIEQMLDFATVRQPRVDMVRIATDELALGADLNGDGVINTSGSERIGFRLRRNGSQPVRLLHSLGRQSMTVADNLPASTELAALDADGNPTLLLSDAQVVLVEINGRRLYSGIGQ
ncbi:MAG: hypothetical protein ACI8TX_000961 [Hyphomicrobiaceae bacterium]|jgi:hypothetical protein